MEQVPESMTYAERLVKYIRKAPLPDPYGRRRHSMFASDRRSADAAGGAHSTAARRRQEFECFCNIVLQGKTSNNPTFQLGELFDRYNAFKNDILRLAKA